MNSTTHYLKMIIILFASFLLLGSTDNATKSPNIYELHFYLPRNWQYYFFSFQHNFLNILLFVLLFTLSQYWQNRRKEYLYYALYIGITWLYFARTFPPYFDSFFSKEENYNRFINFLKKDYGFIFRTELLFFHGITGTYILFVMAFLDFKNKMPDVYKITYKGLQWLLISTLLCLPAFFFKGFYTNTTFDLFLKHLYILAMLWIMVKVITSKLPGANYIAAGSIVLLIGSFATAILHLFEDSIAGKRIFMQMGVLAEIIFFSAALGRKNYDLLQSFSTSVSSVEQVSKEKKELQYIIKKQQKEVQKKELELRKKELELKKQQEKRYGHNSLTPKPTEPESFEQKLERVLSENYSNDKFSIEELASLMDITQSKLNRRIQEVHNMTNIGYLLDYRIKKSILLMHDESLSLNQIADRVGFSQPEYYSKQFKKKKGTSPSAFRKTLLSKGKQT